MTLVGVTLCASVAGGCRSVSFEATPDEMETLAEVLPCVGSLYDESRFGSLVFLDSSRAVTAAHVLGEIEQGSTLTLDDPSGSSFSMRVVRRADGETPNAEAPQDDWAVLHGDSADAAEAARSMIGQCEIEISTHRPEIGQRLIAIGKHERVEENGKTVISTRVRALEVVEPPSGWDDRLIWMRWTGAEDARGMSGGPVVMIDEDGEVKMVGVTVMGRWRWGGLRWWLAARRFDAEMVRELAMEPEVMP